MDRSTRRGVSKRGPLGSHSYFDEITRSLKAHKNPQEGSGKKKRTNIFLGRIVLREFKILSSGRGVKHRKDGGRSSKRGKY